MGVDTWRIAEGIARLRCIDCTNRLLRRRGEPLPAVFRREAAAAGQFRFLGTEAQPTASAASAAARRGLANVIGDESYSLRERVYEHLALAAAVAQGFEDFGAVVDLRRRTMQLH